LCTLREEREGREEIVTHSTQLAAKGRRGGERGRKRRE
jgi:hypothetical protein